MENSVNQGYQIKTSKLNGYATPSAPGTYELEVTNNVTENNQYTDASGTRYIVNLKAIAPDKLEQVRQAFKGKESISSEEAQGLFMTGSIWKAEGKTPVLPMRGEIVKATLALVPSRDGEEVLRITNILVQPAKQAARLDVAKFFAEVEEGELAHS